MTGLRVNGREIPEATIAFEAQNHPAKSAAGAVEAACKALVVRELLLQEAGRRGLSPQPRRQGAIEETEDESLIRQLLEQAVVVEEPSDEECHTLYEAQPLRFISPDLFEASHILLAAAVDDQEKRDLADALARAMLDELKRAPERFADLAAQRSDCPSAADGGRLGQIRTGEVAPELEKALQTLEEEQIYPEPITTRFGVHLLRLHHRARGAVLPFGAVQERLREQLRTRNYVRTVRQFLDQLAETADIEGLDGSSVSPGLGSSN